jgi:hypothetical protein
MMMELEIGPPGVEEGGKVFEGGRIEKPDRRQKLGILGSNQVEETFSVILPAEESCRSVDELVLVEGGFDLSDVVSDDFEEFGIREA